MIFQSIHQCWINHMYSIRYVHVWNINVEYDQMHMVTWWNLHIYHNPMFSRLCGNICIKINITCHKRCNVMPQWTAHITLYHPIKKLVSGMPTHKPAKCYNTQNCKQFNQCHMLEYCYRALTWKAEIVVIQETKLYVTFIWQK